MNKWFFSLEGPGFALNFNSRKSKQTLVVFNTKWTSKINMLKHLLFKFYLNLLNKLNQVSIIALPD